MTSTQKNIELASLYQEVIREHCQRPRFKGQTEQCVYCHEGKNPFCGDKVTVYCEVKNTADGPKISLHFEGSGCSISQASASMMCESMQEVSLSQARQILRHAEDIYTGKQRLHADDLENDLEALYGVSKFPVRIKCAALPWKTLEVLLADSFDVSGAPKPGCHKLTNCVQNNTKKLKVVTTE